MPIAKDDRGFLFWPEAWGAPSLGLETGNLQACIEEVRSRELGGVFGRYPEFREVDLTCLSSIPNLRSAEFWDIDLTDISAIYGLSELKYFRVSGKRPPINFSKLPSVENLIVEFNKKDAGFSELSKLKVMHLWRFKAPVKDAFEFELPESLEKLAIFWSNMESLAGFGVCPNVQVLEIARCRNLRSLGSLKDTFPNLQHLVVDACGRLTTEEASRALEGHPKIKHAFAGKKLIVGTSAASSL